MHGFVHLVGSLGLAWLTGIGLKLALRHPLGVLDFERAVLR